MKFSFDKNGDHKQQFKDAVTRIVRQDIEEQSEKNRLLQDVTDSYIMEIGERPDISELDELASWAYFGYKGLTNGKKSECKMYKSEFVDVNEKGEFIKARRESTCNYCGNPIRENEKGHMNKEYIVVCSKCEKESI